MLILVINCGSTSVKAELIDVPSGNCVAQFRAERLNSDHPTASLQRDGMQQPVEIGSSHAEAMDAGVPRLLAMDGITPRLEAVGHRVVHGGAEFTAPTRVDANALAALEATVPLAPLHNPANLAGIHAAMRLLPELPHVAVFDTAFHRTIPTRAREYALPAALRERYDLRRYGFHGISHEFVASIAAEYLARPLSDLRLVSCHLGGGCSVCAIEYGRSVETSMGMTPLEGLVMATRSGDVDPGALAHLMRQEQWSADDLDRVLNRESGLVGLSGTSSDMRDIERKAEEGDANCQLALQVFCHRVRKYVGAYAATMGGVDAILFTGGIGQNSSTVRHRVAQRLDFLGARIDEQTNRDAAPTPTRPVVDIAASTSRVRVLAVRTNEAMAIAKQTARVAGISWDEPNLAEQGSPRAVPSDPATSPDAHPTIPVAISARHVHLTQETVEALFGAGHQLTPLKELSQPGQFAAAEQVTVVGPKRQIERVRVLGPARSKNQVEISRTDEFFLGVDAPIRASGKTDNTPGVTLIGTDGREVTLESGLICAWRHIHMTPDDAATFNVSDGDIVEVEVGEKGVRSLTFGDVLVRVKSSYKLEMHIDTDEGNAAELQRLDVGEIETDVVVSRSSGQVR